MLEDKVEESWAKDAKSKGALFYKFTSPARRFVPDRIRLEYVPVQHRELVARYIKFMEFKRPKGPVMPGQVRERERLMKQGYSVEIIDKTKEQYDAGK